MTFTMKKNWRRHYHVRKVHGTYFIVIRENIFVAFITAGVTGAYITQKEAPTTGVCCKGEHERFH